MLKMVHNVDIKKKSQDDMVGFVKTSRKISKNESENYLLENV